MAQLSLVILEINFLVDIMKRVRNKDGLKVWVNANSEEIVNKYGVEEAIKQGCNIYRNESKGYVDIYNCPAIQSKREFKIS